MLPLLDWPCLIPIEPMYKLLPEKAREKVKYEYLLRRSVVMVGAFVLVLVVAIVGLFPSYILSKALQKEVAERTQTLGLEPEPEAVVWESWLTGIKLKLKLLAPKLDEDRPSTLLAQVIAERGSGIKINSFSWVKGESKSELAVTGVAADRQALLAFENKLNSSKRFSAVTLPVSNLAKDRDISFEFKLSPI